MVVDCSKLREDHGLPILFDGNPRYSSSLIWGLVVLSCFSSDRPVLGVIDIADLTGLSKSTANRYAITLVALGYLEQNSSRKYRLASHCADVGLSVLNTQDLRVQARTHLEKLRERTGCTASVGVLDGVGLRYFNCLSSHRGGQLEVAERRAVGACLPAVYTAAGKLLLACLPPEEQQRCVEAVKFGGGGPRAISNRERLQAELASLANLDFACNDEELAKSDCSVAVRVRSVDGEVVGAVELAANSSKLTLEEMVRDLLSHVRVAAADISTHLGYWPEVGETANTTA
jgi:IclR family pca regulon transcriptional regulator